MRSACFAITIAIAAAQLAVAAEPVAERRYGDYTIRIIGEQNTGASGRLDIIKHGRLVYTAAEPNFSYQFADGLPTGADLLGTGEPILVVNSYSGGAHCCFRTLLFGIGQNFRLADERPGWDSPGTFRRAGAGWVYEQYDGTFRYWKTAFAFSPQCRVTFRYEHDSWQVAADLMRRRPLQDAQLTSLALSISSDGWDPGEKPAFGRYNPELWEYMLDMVYSGNPDDALRLLDLAWPRGMASEKDQFRREFLAQLRTSPFWSGIEKVSGIPLSPGMAAESERPLCAAA